MEDPHANFRHIQKPFLESIALEMLVEEEGVYVLYGEDGKTYFEVFYPSNPDLKKTVHVMTSSTDLDRLDDYANSAWARYRISLDIEGL